MATRTAKRTITASEFLALIEAQQGKPYNAASNPQVGFDCSGLIWWVLKTLGLKNVPRTSEEQFAWLEKNGGVYGDNGQTGIFHNPKFLLPGALIFYKERHDTQASPNHVAVYVGNGRIFQESQPGVPAGYAPFSTANVVGYAFLPSNVVRQDIVSNGMPLNPASYGVHKLEAPTRPGDWAITVLLEMGINPNRGNIAGLAAQMKLEDVNPAYNNPFGLKVNGRLLRFTNWHDAVKETAKTLNSNPRLVTELLSGNASCSGYANALQHSDYEGIAPSAKEANVAYGAAIGKVCMILGDVKVSRSYQQILNSSGGAAKPEGHLPNPFGSIAAAIEELAKIFGFFTSGKFWLIVLGGIIIIIAVYVLFHHQVNDVAKKGIKTAAMAA